MPKKTTAQSTDQERPIPIVWDIPEDLISGYATNIIVQSGEHEFYVSFFETPPPMLLNPADIKKLESVRAECIARIVIAPDRMEKFVEVLQKQLKTFKDREKAGKKANGSK